MVKWTPKSESDLEDIFEHIVTNFNLDLAVTIVEGLINFTEKTLSENPLAGSIFVSNPLFYKLIYKGNIIFYCENPSDRNLYIIYIQPRKNNFKDDRLNTHEVA